MIAALRPRSGIAPEPVVPSERLAVRIDGRTLLLRVREIDWISADDNNVVLHAAGRSLRIRETLSSIAERLPTDFVRVHRSAMVNALRVAEVRPAVHGEYVIVLSDGVEVPTGRRFRDAVHGLVRQAR